MADSFVRKVDNLKYQQPKSLNVFAESDEVMTIKLRYKEPDGETSQLITKTLRDIPASQQKTSDNFRFSAAVAEFGLLLRNSEYKQNGTMNQVISLAETAKGQDKMGYRKEFISLVKTATSLAVQ